MTLVYHSWAHNQRHLSQHSAKVIVYSYLSQQVHVHQRMRQPRTASTHKWIQKIHHLYTTGYYSAKENEIMDLGIYSDSRALA